jgi:hypothetical protein
MLNQCLENIQARGCCMHIFLVGNTHQESDLEVNTDVIKGTIRGIHAPPENFEYQGTISQIG